MAAKLRSRMGLNRSHTDDYSAGWNMEEAGYLYADEERTVKQRIRDYCVNDGVKLVFVLLFAAANLVLFFERFFYYSTATTGVAAGAFGALGYGVSVARGAAAALKLDCAFILIPVLRNFLSWLRGTWVNNFIPIDKGRRASLSGEGGLLSTARTRTQPSRSTSGSRGPFCSGR